MTTLTCALIMFVLLFGDQLTKALAEAFNVRTQFIPGFMNLIFYKNTGMAFSIFDDNPVAMFFVTLFTVVIIVGLFVMFFTVFKKNTPARVCIAVIEAGAIGNLIDRVLLQYVRDFADVSSIGFGVCNLADFYATFGIIAFSIVILFVGKDAVFPAKKYRAEEAEGEKAALAAEASPDFVAEEGKSVCAAEGESADREEQAARHE